MQTFPLRSSATRESSNSTSKFFSTLLYLPFVEERPTLTPYNDQKIASRAPSFPLISLMMERKEGKEKRGIRFRDESVNLIYRRGNFYVDSFFLRRLFLDPCPYLYPREEDRREGKSANRRAKRQSSVRFCTCKIKEEDLEFNDFSRPILKG